MNRKVILLSIAAIFLMACACPLTSLVDRFTNPENIAESIIDAIPEDITTQMPGEMEEFLEEMPDMSAEEMEDYFDQPVPENIPLVPERNDDLFSTTGIISYSTSVSQSDVEDFYQTEMVNNGWKPVEDSFLSGYALEFENETQSVQILFSQMDSDTYITIMITDK